MPDAADIDYIIEKAREAERRAAAERRVEERLAWLKVGAFWLSFAERVLKERNAPFATMH
jgi:hypothetical protein